MDQNQRGFLDPLDHVGHREGLARAGDTEQRLMPAAGENAGRQLVDGLTLVSA